MMVPVGNYFTWILAGTLAVLAADLLWAFFSLRRKHEVLKVEHAKKDLLLNSIAEGVYGLDLDGNCTFCNRAALHLLGYREEHDLVGQNLHDLIHHTHADGRSYPAAECRACESFRSNREVHLEDEVLWRADGSCFPAEYWSYPLRKGSRLIGAVVSFLDISERKSINARLKETNQALDAFVYTVSHDLRTPISALVGYADLIKEKYHSELSTDIIELLDAIEAHGQRMVVLVEDLLALATAGNLKPPDYLVSSNDELAYVLAELSEEIQRSGATVITSDLPAVKVPGTLLVQIFQNLIGNALRYAGKEGGPIEIGGERLGRQVRFYVRDHGKGIPEEERDSIFEVFCRGSTGKALVGSGIGLATVQKIARLYGGKAWVEETPGGGATFWVEIED